jgi:hypothetical protein
MESLFIWETGILQFEMYYIGPIGSINNSNIVDIRNSYGP